MRARPVPTAILPWLAIPWLAIPLLAVAILLWEGVQTGVSDPDSAMRLAFLTEALTGEGLRHYLFLRDGAPGGMTIMWTLPFDVAVALLAAPLMPWLGIKGALAATAPLHGPLWLCAAGLAAAAVSAGLGLRKLGPWAAYLAIATPAVQTYAIIGRVSHHEATLAIASLTLAAALGAVRRPRPLWGIMAGLLSALAFWQSMETLPAVLAAWGVLVLGGCLRRRAGCALWCFVTAAPLGALLVLLLDPPPEGITALATDRFSAFHVASLLVMAAAVAAAMAASKAAATRRARLWRGLLAAGLVMLAWVAVASAVAPLPADRSDPVVDAYLWQQSVENRPVWTDPGAIWLVAVPQLLALALLAAGAWRRRHRPQGLAWMAAIGLLLAEIGIGIASMRLSSYSGLLAAVACAAALRARLRRPGRADDPALVQVMAAGIAMTFLASIAACLLDHTRMRVSPDACAISAVTAADIEAALTGAGVPVDAVIASEMWLSPGLLWHTRYRTIAGPYHRNTSGVGDLGRIFMARDDAAAQAILGRRGALAVLTCRSAGHGNAAVFPPGSLQLRLMAGQPPGWLHQLSLPERDGQLGLYRVLPPDDLAALAPANKAVP